MNFSSFLTICLCAALTCSSFSVMAEDNVIQSDGVSDIEAKEATNPDIPTPLKVMPSKIKPVQTTVDGMAKASAEVPSGETPITGLDTLSPYPEKGFEPTFWGKEDLYDLGSILERDDLVIRSRTVYKLIDKVALTPAPNDKSEGKNYIKRLNLLVQIGDFANAVALYKLNPNVAPSPLTARLGLTSMIGSGDIATACLEYKALGDDLKAGQESFYRDMETYCDTLLEMAATENQSLQSLSAANTFLKTTENKDSVNTNSLNSQNVIRVLALAQANQLTSFLKEAINIESLSNRNLSTLLSIRHLDKDVKFALVAEAVKRGIMDEERVDTFLKEEAANLVQSTNKKNSSKTNYWDQFLKLYSSQKGPSPELLNHVRKGTDLFLLEALADPWSEALATPPLSENTLTNFSAESAQKLLTLILYSAEGCPSNVLEKAFPVTSDDKTKTCPQILIDYLEEKFTSKKPALAQIFAVKDTLLLKNQNDPEKFQTYENIFSLTDSGSYVMPSDEILSSLKKYAEQKQTTQVVIESLKVLTDVPPDKMNPAVLMEILKMLGSAGLDEETVSLSREVIGNILEK